MKTKLTLHKKIVVIIGSIIILLASLGILFYNSMANEMYIIHSSMSSTMFSFESKYKRALNVQNISIDMDEELVWGDQYLVKEIFKESKDVQTALDLIKSENVDCYLLDSNEKIHASKGSNKLTLSQDQLAELKNAGKLVLEENGNNVYFYCFDVPGGKAITCNKNIKEMEANSALTGISERFDYYVAPLSDGIVSESSEAELIGTHIPAKIESVPIKLDRNCNSKNEEYKAGFVVLGIGKAYCLTYEVDGYLFGVYYPYFNMLIDAIDDMLAPAIVLLGTFVVTLFFFFSLWNSYDEKNSKLIKLFRGKYIEESQVRHLAGFWLLAFICVLLFSIHVFEFSSYSLQNILSMENLEILSENMDASDKDRQVVIDILEEYSHDVSDKIADILVLNEELPSREKLSEIADNVYMNEVSVYDSNGVLEASSGDYCGYELTQNENDPRYNLRKVLTDGEEYVFIDCDDGSGRYFVGQRRKDEPGVICLEYTNPQLTGMLKYYSKEEAIKDTDFGNATTFFVRVNGDSNTTYVVEPYTSEIESSQIEIPETLNQDNFTGIAEIGGIKSYVNTKKGGEILVISSIDAKSFDATLVSDVLVLFVTFVCFLLLLFYGCICCPEVDEKEQDESEVQEQETVLTRNNESIFADDCFRKMLKREFIVLIFGYCLMMLKRTTSGQTLLEFVFEGKWDKGVNLFSINASIIVAVVIVLALFLIKKILLFIGHSIGAKGTTVCSIAVSLLQFLGLFYIILYALYQFGVNTSALVASAGVTGLAIGIAAKDVVGDLIAGLFLIFEGNITVGDFVRYKDFRGEVSEIGARVTVIKRYNNKLIVNNSDLKQYYRLSDEFGAAWVEIEVGADEDIEKIKTLIQESEEWYQSKIPTLKGGPWFLNVTDFNSSGITIALCGSCIEERSGSTKRKLLLYTMELFRENGITLGKNLIKVDVNNEDI